MTDFTRRSFLGMSIGGAAAFCRNSAIAGGDGAWLDRRAELKKAWLEMLGPFPEKRPSLDPAMKRVDDIQGIECHHVTYRSESDDRVTAYLLIPEGAREGPTPAVICPHSTTGGTGKDRIVGLAGGKPGEPPDPPETSRSYGLELARWGYVTLSIDLICDGERIPEGLFGYNTSAFYERHPEWSAVGKNAWDVSCGFDFLETLDFVDSKRVACLGHSLGGHTSLFSGAFDQRIAAVVTNGGMLSWVRGTQHWSRKPKPDSGPVDTYIYIPRFQPYYEDQSKPIPVDFDGLMMLVAPRPLLIMATEEEMARHDTIEKEARAAEVYRQLDAGDRISLFSYPGGHNYPPVAKRYSFSWLDRWFGHTPAVPSIWPGKAI